MEKKRLIRFIYSSGDLLYREIRVLMGTFVLQQHGVSSILHSCFLWSLCLLIKLSALQAFEKLKWHTCSLNVVRLLWSNWTFTFSKESNHSIEVTDDNKDDLSKNYLTSKDDIQILNTPDMLEVFNTTKTISNSQALPFSWLSIILVLHLKQCI